VTVYLDSWGHLFSDKSIKDLWEFSERIGMRKDWNHYSRGFPHFDLTTMTMVRKAVAAGAKEVSIRDPAWRALTNTMTSKTFNRAWHESVAVWLSGTGLIGQKILRLDITATIERELRPTAVQGSLP
jgi:hypothetical protein